MNGNSTGSLDPHAGLLAILRWHGSDLRLAALTVVVFVTMSLLNPGKFLSAANFESMAFQFPELALLSFAMLLAMLSGGIDLSVVAIANLCGILAAMILTGELAGGEPPGGTAASLVLAVVVAVACGVGCGSLNGLLISRLEVSPILATLGTMQLFAGAGLILTGGRAVHGFPESFLALGNGSLWGVPVPFLLFGAAAALVWLLSSRTALGIQDMMARLRASGRTQFSMGISVHTGRAQVAHFIVDERTMDRTVIGRNVNIAGRLSSSGKLQGLTLEKDGDDAGPPPDGERSRRDVWVDEQGVLFNAGIVVSQDTVEEIVRQRAAEPWTRGNAHGYRLFDDERKKNILLEYVGDAKFKGVARSIAIYRLGLEDAGVKGDVAPQVRV